MVKARPSTQPTVLKTPPSAQKETATGATPTWSTAALCQHSGVTRGMLRLYEREGLLTAPPRAANGYRLYPAGTPQRLQAIRQLKELGFSLREIELLLSERDETGLSVSQLRKLAQTQLVQIDERLAQLQLVRLYVHAVAQGDMSAIQDPECQFLTHFLGAKVS